MNNVKGYLEILYEEVVKNSKYSARDMYELLYIICPHDDKQNLFKLILEPKKQSLQYNFFLQNAPFQLQNCINRGDQQSSVYMRYVEVLEYQQLSIRFENKVLILNPIEYYLFILLSSMKNFSMFYHRLNKDLSSPQTDEFSLDLIQNPYLVIIQKLVNNLLQYHTGKTTILKLFFLIEEYFIDENIFLYNLANNLSSDDFQMQQQLLTSSVLQYSIRSGMAAKNNFRADAEQAKFSIPQPHVFEAITLLLYYKRIYQDKVNIAQMVTISKYYQLQIHSEQFVIRLFKFFYNCLTYWMKEQKNTSSTIADLGYTWFFYIRFWDRFFTQKIEECKKIIDNNFDYCDVTQKQGLMYLLSAQNQKKLICQLPICNGMDETDMKNDLEMVDIKNVNQFVKQNIPFFTILFNKLLSVYSVYFSSYP